MTKIESLRTKHADVLNSDAVQLLSNWRQHNSDIPLDIEKYAERSKKNLEKFFEDFESSKTN